MSENMATKGLISTDDLKEFLECPVCLRVPRSAPVYQCDRGHVVCNECHPKLTTCPVCRFPMGRTRSLISEKVLAKMPSACQFVDNGCSVEAMKDSLVQHEEECAYRLVHCVDLACQQMVPFHKLMHHMTKEHEREDFVKADGSSYVSHFIVNEEDFHREIMWISDHLQLDGRHFFRECCRNGNGLWYVWVYLVGTKTEAKEYSYEIKISSDDQNEQLIYRGQVVSLDIPKEDLALCGSALIFPDASARKFWSDQKINYKVNIRPKKKAKDVATDKKDDTNAKQSSKNESKNAKKKHDKETKKSKSEISVDGAVKPESASSDPEDVKETPC